MRAQNEEMLTIGTIETNLYQIELKKVNGVEVSTLSHTLINGDTMELWHK